MTCDDVIHLHRAGVSLAFGISAEKASVLHWGRDLGDLTSNQLDFLLASNAGPVLNNAPDVPRELTILPMEAEGWAGNPAVAGHIAGGATTPRPHLVGIDRSNSESGDHVEFVHHDSASNLEIVVRFTLTVEGIVETETRVRRDTTGVGQAPYDLASVMALMPLPARAEEIMDFTGRWCRERAPQRTTVVDGAHIRETRRGKPGADNPTLMIVGTAGFGFGAGELWAAHLGWSGNGRWVVERLPERAGVAHAVLGAGELLNPGEIRLYPGDEYRSPTTIFAWSGDGMDGMADRLHRRQRRQLSYPRHPRPLVLNSWEAVYFDHDLDTLLNLVDRAADVGVERFVLDDGWFLDRRNDTAGLGDWIVDPKTWPKGLHPLVDRVRSRGMSFGLWVEPEMISPDSQLARQHSDWILGPRRGAGPTSRHQQVLDISNPDAWAFILDRISSLVDEYSIDFLKWDHNRDLLEAVRDVHGTRRPAVHDQTRALYALIDELHRRHPTLEIESCSAGGGRIDLEMMTRSQRVWLTDCNDPVERENIQQWSGLLLPPELIGTHVGAAESHTTHRHARLPFQLISSLFSHAGVERDLTTCDSDTLRTFQRWAALYKELRPVLHSGRTVHADLSDPALLLHGVVAEDKRHAVFAWVSLATPEGAHAGRVRFPGLNTELDYDLRIHTELGEPQYAEIAHPDWYSRAVTDGAEISGAILAQVGVPLPTLAPADALLIELIAVND